jgi:hypothetical protein
MSCMMLIIDLSYRQSGKFNHARLEGPVFFRSLCPRKQLAQNDAEVVCGDSTGVRKLIKSMGNVRFLPRGRGGRG